MAIGILQVSPYPCQHLLFVALFDDSYSGRHAVISHCGFDLHFSDDYSCWPSMYLLVHICISSLEKGLFSPLLILNQVVFCCWVLGVLYKFWILIPNVWFANIASQSLSCLFTLLILSLHVQQFFNFIKFHLFILSFVAYAFDVISKKLLPDPKLWSFSPMFPFKNFIVWSLLSREDSWESLGQKGDLTSPS